MYMCKFTCVVNNLFANEIVFTSDIELYTYFTTWQERARAILDLEHVHKNNLARTLSLGCKDIVIGVSMMPAQMFSLCW